MGDVDDHALRFHPPNNLTAKGGQSAFFQAMHRTRQFIVKEMGKPRHTKTGVIQPVQIGCLAFQILKAFDGQHRSDGPLIFLPRGE